MANKEAKISTFIKRLVSGIILLSCILISLYKGDLLLLNVTAIISIIGLFELYRAMKLQNSYFAYLNYMLSLLYYILLYRASGYTVIMLIIIATMSNLICYVVSYPKYKINEVLMAIFGFLYVTVLFSFMYLVRQFPVYGKYYIWLMLISSWGSDTSAYCIGMLFGKNKLFKKLSPNKSIEGAIGGIIGSGILGFIYAILVNRRLVAINVSIPLCVFLCMACSMISQLGDLVASGIKRDFDLKDYGELIPGHGGILDRFDSIIFTAPAIYCIILIFYYIN